MADQSNQSNIFQAYTPGSDLAAGFNPNQIIWGRTGNDTFLGYQPIKAKPGQEQIDIFIGDVAIEDPAFRQWNDTFILGDWQQAYYNSGNSDDFGLNDFGFIADFNPAQDFIQLYGSPNDYQLVDVGVGSALLSQQETGSDVIGFLLGNSNLSLGDNYFNFQGYTPPKGSGLQKQTQQLGSSGFDVTPTITTDRLGNVYTAGGTSGSLEGRNNGDSRDALVTKYDSQGNLLWTKQFGTSELDTIYGIDTDNQGNFYVTGITQGELEGTKQGEVSDAWVAKYDSDGNQLWLEQFGQNLIFQSFSIEVDNDGDVYLSGIDVKPADEIATDDSWVAKFDTNGNRQWLTEIGSDAFDESYGLTVSNDGSVYATGWTLGDLAGENAGLYDAWLGKLDNNGEVEWLRQFGTSDYDWGWSVDTDSLGNVYATGWTLGDLGGDNAGSYDAWLTKYDSSGNQQWIQQFGSPGDDEGFRINIDSNDNIFLTGYTNGSLGGENAGSYDSWVAKYDTDGNQEWIQQYGTPDLDQAYGLTSNNGNVYLTGVTQGSFGNTNAGSFDSWVAKVNGNSGRLRNFNGASNSVNASPALDFVVNNTSNNQPTDEQMVDFLGNFFQEFISNTLNLPSGSGGPNGAGLGSLVSNPYGQPASVPEASSGVGLLMFAAVSCIAALLKARLKSSSKSRILIH